MPEDKTNKPQRGHRPDATPDRRTPANPATPARPQPHPDERTGHQPDKRAGERNPTREPSAVPDGKDVATTNRPPSGHPKERDHKDPSDLTK